MKHKVLHKKKNYLLPISIFLILLSLIVAIAFYCNRILASTSYADFWNPPEVSGLPQQISDSGIVNFYANMFEENMDVNTRIKEEDFGKDGAHQRFYAKPNSEEEKWNNIPIYCINPTDEFIEGTYSVTILKPTENEENDRDPDPDLTQDMIDVLYCIKVKSHDKLNQNPYLTQHAIWYYLYVHCAKQSEQEVREAKLKTKINNEEEYNAAKEFVTMILENYKQWGFEGSGICGKTDTNKSGAQTCVFVYGKTKLTINKYSNVSPLPIYVGENPFDNLEFNLYDPHYSDDLKDFPNCGKVALSTTKESSPVASGTSDWMYLPMSDGVLINNNRTEDKTGTSIYIQENKTPTGFLPFLFNHEITRQKYPNLKSESGYHIESGLYDYENPLIKNITLFNNLPFSYLNVKKIDSVTSKALQNAEFTYKFYGKNQFFGENVKTWKFKTNQNGEINFRYDTPIQGSDTLYKYQEIDDKSGEVIGKYNVIPGYYDDTDSNECYTYFTIEETKAPAGYKIDSTIHYYRIKCDGKNTIVQEKKSENIWEDVTGSDLTINIKNTPPEISTQAFNIDEKSKTVKVGKNISILDKVTCKGLASEQNYMLKGKLIDRDSKSVIAESKSDEFKASLSDEKIIDVKFENVDTTKVSNKTLVVFESLYAIDDKKVERLVVSHESLDDENQQIKVTPPEIETEALWINGDKEIAWGEIVSLSDSVSLKDIDTSLKYYLKGSLAWISEGGVITFITEKYSDVFTPNGDPFTTEVIFDNIDTKLFAGKKLVVYEDLFIANGKTVHDGGILIATHQDKDDEQQQVTITSPEIKTYAFSAENDKDINIGPNEKIIDKVECSKLLPDKNYWLFGTLNYINDNGDVIKLCEDSSDIFTPDSESYLTYVSFENVDTTLLANKTLVVYEQLYMSQDNIRSQDDILLFSHAEKDDKLQQVYVKSDNNSVNPLTGDNTVWFVLITFIIAVNALVILRFRSYNK